MRTEERELERERHMTWVDVNEQLPGKTTNPPDVLVVCAMGPQARWVGLDQYDHAAGDWLIHHRKTDQRVTHWQPKPPLPVESSP